MADTKPAAPDNAAEEASESSKTTVATDTAKSKTKPDASVSAGSASTDAYAIVEASGTQVWLQTNRYYDLDRIHAEVDDTVISSLSWGLTAQQSLCVSNWLFKGSVMA